MDSAPSLERFRGFVNNLRTEAPGEILRGENGQELLRQYVYPGLQPEDGLERLEEGRLSKAIDLFAHSASLGSADGNFHLGLAYAGLLGRADANARRTDGDHAVF